MPHLSRCDLAVVIRLVSAYNPKRGYAFPSLETIATDTRAGKRQVIRSVARLERLGVISVSRSTGRGHANTYVPQFDRVPEGHVYSAAKGDTQDTLSDARCKPERVTSSTERVTNQSRKGDSQDTPNDLLNALRNRSAAAASPSGDAHTQESIYARDAKVCATAERALRTGTLTKRQAKELIDKLEAVVGAREPYGDNIYEWANRLLEEGEWP